MTPPKLPPPGSAGALSGRRVVGSGLVVGLVGLAIAFFLRAVVANTPVRVNDYTLFWSTVLAGAFGLVAGMAVEAVRQLQRTNPDPEYRRGGRSRRRPTLPTGPGGPGRGNLP
ncbi:MAG: hypothetical protein ACK5QW_04515 [Cyanobacteriota bacterium]|jgi:hypothetical protein